MTTPGESPDKEPFPIFGSLAEAEAFSDQTGDAYYEICYHMEGHLNVCLMAMHDLYANAPVAKRPKMQTGLVSEAVCPAGWPKHPQTLLYLFLACRRFRHEDTAHAATVNEAMAALLLEFGQEARPEEVVFDPRTLEMANPADAEKLRPVLLRLCDWIESRLHYATHRAWYRAPDCFSEDPVKAHLANIGIAQRHLANLPERDRKRWEGIHARAAAKHGADLKMWSTVGKVQHDPEPRTWTHPDVDERIIGLWPLVVRYNWTYADLLNVLEQLLPLPPGRGDRCYPLDSVESLKVHCRSICGLTKPGKGRSAEGLPAGWPIAERLFSRTGK